MRKRKQGDERSDVRILLHSLSIQVRVNIGVLIGGYTNNRVDCTLLEHEQVFVVIRLRSKLEGAKTCQLSHLH